MMIVVKLVNKLPVFYAIQIFFTVFTKDCHLSLIIITLRLNMNVYKRIHLNQMMQIYC